MERAQTRWLLALGVLLGLVVAALFAQGSPDPADASGDTVPLWSVDPAAIEYVSIQRADRTIALELRGDAWFVTAPFEARADPDRVRALFRLLATPRGEPVPDPLPLEEYGLGAEPVARITVRLAGGLERTLWVGNAVPVGFRTYVAGADGRVLTVPGDAHRVVADKAEAFRDHRMFTFDPAEVRRVTLISPRGQLTVRGQGSVWGLDGFGRADPRQVDDLVMGLLDLRYDVIWEQDTWVEPPRFGARVVLEDGSEQVMHVGDETPLGAVTSTNDGRYGTIFSELLRQFDRGDKSLSDRRSLPLDLELADEILVEVEGQEVVARRNGPAWLIDGISPATSYDAVRALSEAEALYSSAPPEGAAEGAGQVRIREGDELRVVTLGAVDGDVRVVRDIAHPDAYRIREADLRAFLHAAGRD